MSRKSLRNQPRAQSTATDPSPTVSAAATQAGSASRRGLLAIAGAAALLAAGGGTYLALRRSPTKATSRPGLASEHAPTLGAANAKVHIVEFLDPACETCAVFFPLIKRMLADHPDRIRLSVRHVPFHRGSDEIVRLLEASRQQDRYWQTLEALLASQGHWAANHTARTDLALQALAPVGLDLARLQADMRAPEVDQRIAQDRRDAEALQVSKTPEYFVNGRQMASFGRQQLQDLIREELQRAY
jgi:protein-disulfide isomerase